MRGRVRLLGPLLIVLALCCSVKAALDKPLQLFAEPTLSAVQAALDQAAESVLLSEGTIQEVQITVQTVESASGTNINPEDHRGIEIPFQLASQDVHLIIQAIHTPVTLSAGLRLNPGERTSHYAPGNSQHGMNIFHVGRASVGCDDPPGVFRPRSDCEGCAPEELFCEDRRLVRAQYPNRASNGRQQEWLHILNVTEHSNGTIVEIHLDPSELESEQQVDRWWKEVSSDWGNVWLHGQFFLPWADDFVRVAGVQRGAHPSLLVNLSATPVQYPFKINQRFTVVNSFGDLDAVGEYYLQRISDSETKIFALLSQACVNSHSLLLTHAPHVVSSSAHVSNTVFRNLNFRFSRAAAVSLPAGASGVTFDGCGFASTGTEGLNVMSESSAMVHVLRCAFRDTGCGGARLEGGHVYSLLGGGHVISDSAFARASQWVMTYTPAVGLTGVGHEVRGCSFRDMPHMAVGKASSPSRQTRIAEMHTGCTACRVLNSSFYDIAHTSNDAAAVYFANNVLTRVTVEGCVFEKVRHDVTSRTWGFRKVAAVYYDLGVSYGTTAGNQFRDVDIAVIVNKGIKHTIQSNDVTDSDRAVYVLGPFVPESLCVTYHNGPDSVFGSQLALVDYGRAPAWEREYPLLARHMDGVDCTHANTTAVPHSTVIAFNRYRNLSVGFHNASESVLQQWGVLLHANEELTRVGDAEQTRVGEGGYRLESVVV